MNKSEKTKLVKELIHSAFWIIILTLVLGLVINDGGIASITSFARDCETIMSPVNCKIVLGADILTIVLIIVYILKPIFIYSKLRISQKDLELYVKTRSWVPVELVDVLSMDQHFVLTKEPFHPILNFSDRLYIVDNKKITRRFRFYENGKYILVQDKVFSRRFYLYST